jgi:putative N6-adenine-specific DNA methylase
LKSHDNFKIVARTFQGLEDVLAKEIKDIGGDNIHIIKRAVSFYGNKELLYKANLYLRTALNVVVPIKTFRAQNEFHLYSNVQRVNWSQYMSYRDTLLVSASVNSRNFKHSKYVIYKVKDAIADQFQKTKGKRPDINLQDPTLKVHINISSDSCILSLDSSGEPLYKRGYREEEYTAPLNQVVAAGLVLLSGWKKDCHLIDPMCGSGTIPIEAAMIANNVAPGLNRKFNFQNWKDYDHDLWENLKAQAESKIIPFRHKIIGNDIAPRAIRISKKHLLNANLRSKVTFEVADFEQYNPPQEPGFIIINPPYGERLSTHDIDNFYQKIGDILKQKYSNYTAYILSSNMDALKKVGLRSEYKKPLMNGSLECRYIKYPLYKGSKNEDKKGL